MESTSHRIAAGYRWVLQPLLVFGVLLIGFFGAKGLSSRNETPPSFAKRTYSPLVSVDTTKRTDTPVLIRATGALEPITRVSLVAQVEGRVVAIHPAFNEGGTFRAGEPLVRIERTDFELAVARAQAEVSSAGTALEALQAEAEAAREEWKVLHGDQPVPPLVGKEPQLREAQARVAAAQATLRGARLDLERTEISLPWPGRVVSAHVNVGGVVSRNQALGNVYSTQGYEMSVPLRADQLRWVQLPGEATEGPDEGPIHVTASVAWSGASLTQLEEEVVVPIERVLMAVEGLKEIRTHASAGLASVVVETTGEFAPAYMRERIEEALDSLDSFPPQGADPLEVLTGLPPSPARAVVRVAGETVTLPGHAVLFEGELDSTSRFASVVLNLDTSRLPASLVKRLLPGTFADVEIEGNTIHDVTSIQRSSLRTGNIVWVYEEGRLRFAPVETVYLDDHSVWVRGLEDGARVVTSDLEVVTDGMQVRIPEEAAAPDSGPSSNSTLKAQN